MEMDTIEDGRLRAVRRELAKAVTYHDAMIALSSASLATLRELERAYTSWPGDAHGLRDRIARAHLRRVNGNHLRDTKGITLEQMRDWAEGTLSEWLPGYTDFIEQLGGQFKIDLISINDGEDGGCVSVYEVSTADGYDPRRFVVRVLVEECPADDSD